MAESESEALAGRRGGWGRTFESLSVPQYRVLFSSSFLLFAALQMTVVARPWLAYDVSDSALSLGFVAAAQGVAMLVASPFAGVAADRLPKRSVLLASHAALLISGVVLATIVILDVVEVWHLVLLALAHGGTVPFSMPVRQAYIPELIPRSMMANGVALHSTGRNFNQIAAPATVGVLLAFEPVVAFVLIVVLHVISTLISLRLPFGAPAATKGRGMTGELLFGLRYMMSNPMLRTLIWLALLAVALGFPYQHLMPVFQKDVLEVGPSRLGFMYSALGTGALTASLMVASFSGLVRKGFPQLLMGIVFGLGLVAFALSPFYLLAVALLFVTGFASQAYTTMNMTLMMMTADPALYGRVASVNMMTRAFMPLAVLPFGVAVDVYGAPVTVAAGGAALALAVLLTGLARPDLWRQRDT
jgi:MFS family permease